MPGLKDINTVWRNVREVDLRPLQEAALRPVRIALVGAPGSGRRALATQIRSDPARPSTRTQSPVLIADLEATSGVLDADLVVLVLEATQKDTRQAQELARQWANMGKSVLVFVNRGDMVTEGQVLDQWVDWGRSAVLYGSAGDVDFLSKEFVPAVLHLLPERHAALGRQFPLFRVAIARRLISETCLSNAAYALSTGLAEVVPVLDLPLNVTDMIVLTKSQAFLVYKLGLLLGLSTRWQDYVTEFGGVIGGGFLWRQLARQLVGLIPVWGIVPKVAVAYAGTYVVGNAILQWYLTGRHLSRKQMRALYVEAFARGKQLARDLVSRVPRPGRRRREKEARSLPPGDERPAGKARFRPGRGKRKALPAGADSKVCASCGKPSAGDANFCQYCGQTLEDKSGVEAPDSGEVNP